MFRNYLLVSLRNIWKQKAYSLINISGLAIGLMSCMLILMYIRFETSYDAYHEKADRIYRIAVNGALGGNEFHMALSCAPLAPALLADFPEVEKAIRIRGNFGFPVFRYKNAVFSEERWSAADSTIFEVFDLPFVLGDPATALNRPLTIILTESTANRYFGNENPIGKLLNMDNRLDWEVTGVIEDFPDNSHFHYDMLSSLVTYPQMTENDMWVNNNFLTYVLLREGASREAFDAKLPELIQKYVGPKVEEMLGISFEQLQKTGANYEFFSQALLDIHLDSHLDNEIEANGNPAAIYIFMIIALFILVIACINYMNLATARYSNRTREVGIRKTLGSTRSQLITQFLTESIMITLAAVALAILLIELSLPTFNSMIGLHLSLNIPLILSAFAAGLAVGFLAGSYPAFYLSHFNPSDVFRADQVKGSGRGWLRNGLVVFQFAVSIFLIIGTLVVNQQLTYMMNEDLGLNPDQILVVEKTDDIGAHIHAFKNALLENPSILQVSNSTSIPGDMKSVFANVMRTYQNDEEVLQLVQNVWTDYSFLDTYEIKLVEGRFFSREFLTDSMAVVINEKAAEIYGFENPLEETFLADFGMDGQLELNILGVMKDFHYASLQDEIRPMAIYLFNNNFRFGKFVSIKLESANLPQTIAFIEKTWKNFAKDQAFEYVIFDDHYAKQYESEILIRKLLTYFTLLALFIACLGLLGLASYSAERRKKEIGIRKVLGASAMEITRQLSLEFTRWVLWANLIAFPLAWYFLNRWLEDFAFRINLNIFVFLFAGVLAMIIALVTVSYQTMQAANSNPVKSIQNE